MIENLVQELAMSLGKFGTGAYLIVSLVVLLETIVVVGQFIPGSLLLIMAGFLCYMGVFDFNAMLLSVMLAHIAGEHVNYALGRFKGRTLFHPDNRFFRPRLLEMAESRFEASGTKLLITGQFLGFLRPFITLAAGASQYPALRFFLAMIPACLLWAVVPLGIGYLCGASWQKAVGYMRDFSLVLIVGIPFAVFSGWCIQQLLQLSGYLRTFLERLNRAIHNTPWYMRLSSRNPRTFKFLERRVSLSRSWGLGATFGFFCALVSLSLCFIILWDVNNPDHWYNFDLSLVNLLAQLRTPGANRFFLVVTHLGAATVVTVVVVIASVTCLLSKQHKSMFVIITAVALGGTLAQVLEYVFRRARPDTALHLVEAHGFSSPSGHATAAFALFGTLYYWLWNHPGVLRIRATLAFLLLLAAFLVGFSRIYLGVHYPSDIVAGFCLGFACVLACATIAANWDKLRDVQSRADLKATAVIVIYVLTAWAYTIYRPITVSGHDFIRPATTAASLDKVAPYLPTGSTTVLGYLYVPVNLVIEGDAEPVVDRLVDQGWELVRPQDFFTRGIANPVFPAFLNSQPPVHMLQQHTDDGRRIFRLWHTSTTVDNRQLWLGSVVYQDREMKWKRVDVYHQDPDIDLAAMSLADDLTSASPRTIQLRERGLYEWRNVFFTHGHVPILRTDQL